VWHRDEESVGKFFDIHQACVKFTTSQCEMIERLERKGNRGRDRKKVWRYSWLWGMNSIKGDRFKRDVFVGVQ
jgi:hypothetical protein